MSSSSTTMISNDVYYPDYKVVVKVTSDEDVLFFCVFNVKLEVGQNVFTEGESESKTFLAMRMSREAKRKIVELKIVETISKWIQPGWIMDMINSRPCSSEGLCHKVTRIEVVRIKQSGERLSPHLIVSIERGTNQCREADSPIGPTPKIVRCDTNGETEPPRQKSPLSVCSFPEESEEDDDSGDEK